MYFPTDEEWFHIQSHTFVQAKGYQDVNVHPHQMPAYVRAGAILAMKNIKRPSVLQGFNDPLTLEVYLDPTIEALDQKAATKVYLDDGETNKFSDGDMSLVGYEFSENKLE